MGQLRWIDDFSRLVSGIIMPWPIDARNRITKALMALLPAENQLYYVSIINILKLYCYKMPLSVFHEKNMQSLEMEVTQYVKVAHACIQLFKFSLVIVYTVADC